MMFRWFGVCLCLMLVMVCGVLYADQPSQSVRTVKQPVPAPLTALQSLSQSLSAMDSMTAEFDQRVLDQDGTLLQQSHGHMAWQRPERFKWTVIAPNQQIMVADGKWLWVYTPSLLQVNKQTLSHQAGTPASLLSGSVDTIGPQFTVSVQRQKDMVVYHLQPKDPPQAPFASIELVMVNGKLSSMRFKDKLDQSTVFAFSNVAVNQSLPKDLFAFTPPATASVLDQTVTAP